MKRMTLFAVVVALGIAVAIARVGETTYVDATGDSGTAPDLAHVVVTDSNGLVVFKIDGTLVPLSAIQIFVDADRNQSTGGDGDELRISVFMEGDGKSYYDAERWNGSKWDDVTFDVHSQTFTGREEIGFDAAAAGLKGTFDFVPRSVNMVADAVEGEIVPPDSILPWSYTLSTVSATAAKVVLGKPTFVPARPVAGRAVTVRAAAQSAGVPVATGATTCTAKIGARTIRGRGSVANGVASCRLAVPRGTSKATARGSITVGSGATAVTKAFSFRIA